MDNNYVNITRAVPLDALSPIEVDATLRCVLGSTAILPDNPNRAIYGSAVEVLHKADGERILEIRADRQYWEKEGRRFREVMKRAAEPQEVKIRSKIVFSQGGELPTPPFRWKDDFQLGRAPDEGPRPAELSARYPCLFQFAVPYADLPWLDAHRVESVFKKRFLPLLPLMRQYCTTYLEYDASSSSRKSWVLEQTDGGIKSHWLQIGYQLPTHLDDASYLNYEQPATTLLPIDRTDPNWLTSVHLSHSYNLYENLSPDDRRQFLLGCEWLNKALVANDSTDQVLFLMIMLEIFLPSDSVPCDACGQPRYAISEKFRTFIPEVVGEKWSPEFTTVLNRLYSLRSRIAHTGIAIAQYSGGMIPVEWKEQGQRVFLFRLARQFLVSWLFYCHSTNRNEHKA